MHDSLCFFNILVNLEFACQSLSVLCGCCQPNSLIARSREGVTYLAVALWRFRFECLGGALWTISKLWSGYGSKCMGCATMYNVLHVWFSSVDARVQQLWALGCGGAESSLSSPCQRIAEAYLEKASWKQAAINKVSCFSRIEDVVNLSKFMWSVLWNLSDLTQNWENWSHVAVSQRKHSLRSAFCYSVSYHVAPGVN